MYFAKLDIEYFGKEIYFDNVKVGNFKKQSNKSVISVPEESTLARFKQFSILRVCIRYGLLKGVVPSQMLPEDSIRIRCSDSSHSRCLDIKSGICLCNVGQIPVGVVLF